MCSFHLQHILEHCRHVVYTPTLRHHSPSAGLLLAFNSVLVSVHLAMATNPPEFILTADKCGAQISALQQLHGRSMNGGQ